MRDKQTPKDVCLEATAVADFAKNEKVENFQIFDGNHGLNL